MFFDPDELRAFQDFASPFLVTPVEIFRAAVAGEGWASPEPAGYNSAYDYGDDELAGGDAEDPGTYPIAGGDGKLLAWFFSHLQSDVSDDSGQMGTIDIHEVRLPIGTNILSQDLLRNRESGDIYVVVDANNDDSFPDMLRANLRRRE